MFLNSWLDSYTYDTNGVRVSKKVNGCTTEFNILGSKILAEDGVNGEIYFQYSGDELIGFHLNDAQYFYIKNLNGDIVGIEDYDGNLIAQYEYDEWGLSSALYFINDSFRTISD